MKQFLVKEWYWWFLPIAFLIMLGFRLINNDSNYTDIVILLTIVGIASYVILFKKELFISLLIISIPLSINSIFGDTAVTAPTEFMVAILAMVFIIMSIAKPVVSLKILYHPLSILLLIDLMWMLIAAFYSEVFIFSLKRVFIRMLYLVTFYMLMANWMMEKKNMMKFFLLYAIGLIIPIIITEIHHARYNFDPRTVFELCKPFFNDHTIFGACIAYVIPFMFIVSWNADKLGFGKFAKYGCWVLLGILIIGEYFAFSRAAWISLGVSLLFYGFLKLRLKFIHLIFLLLVFAGIISYYSEDLYNMAKRSEMVSNKGEVTEHLMSVGNLNTDASNLERINRWNSAIRMFEDRPLTGFGPGTYQFVYGPYQSVYEMTYISTMAGDKGNAHSEPLTYLSETGLPGFISYLIWTLAVLAYGIRAYYRSKDFMIKNLVLAALLGFITFYFHGLVNSFIDQVKMAGLLFGSMAIIVVADIYSRTITKTQNETQKVA